jgi:exodeoxyribonuclease VII large subunit
LTQIQHIKLSELTRQVRDAMRGAFPDSYWIVAEVSGHKFYPNNDRHYFELVEKAEGSNEPIAKVNARAWYEGSQTIHTFETVTGQKFTTNLQVLIKVKVEFHPAHGFALILVDIDPSFTLGNLEKQRLETLQRLVDENPDAIKKLGDEYITRNKNLELNPVIQNIAIIGSPNSEGYVDFTHTLENNQYGYRFNIDIYQSSVQGMAAEKELVNRFIDIHSSQKKYDCVVLIRGGGAKTDFLVFDTYQLSRAAARFPIPIITGLGHHKDVSIVDLMVHTSVKTPTKAAEFIIAHNRRFEEDMLVMQRTIIIKSQQMMAEQVQRMNATQVLIMNQTRLLVTRHQEYMQGFKQVVTRQGTAMLQKQQTSIAGLINTLKSGTKMAINHEQMEVKNRAERIKTFSSRYLANQKTKMDNFHSIIKIMDPKNILKKGFAMVAKDGKIISDPKNLQPGTEITVIMEKYDIHTQVTSTKKNGTT